MSGISRINSTYVAKLASRYRGAEQRVNTLNAQIDLLETTIRNGYVVISDGKTNSRKKLSTPELDKKRDERNLLKIDLLQAKEDLKVFKSDYQMVVRQNQYMSSTKLVTLRKEVEDRKIGRVSVFVQKTLNNAATTGLRSEVIALKQIGESDGVNTVFKRKLIDIVRKSGHSDFRYLPTVSGIQILEGLKQWDATAGNQPVFGN